MLNTSANQFHNVTKELKLLFQQLCLVLYIASLYSSVNINDYSVLILHFVKKERDTHCADYTDYEWTQVHESGLYKHYHHDRNSPEDYRVFKQNCLSFTFSTHFVKSLTLTQLQGWKLLFDNINLSATLVDIFVALKRKNKRTNMSLENKEREGGLFSSCHVFSFQKCLFLIVNHYFLVYIVNSNKLTMCCLYMIDHVIFCFQHPPDCSLSCVDGSRIRDEWPQLPVQFVLYGILWYRNTFSVKRCEQN